MTTDNYCPNVIDALKKCKKGQLQYDSFWNDEGKTEEIVNSVKQNLTTLNLSSPLSSQNFFTKEKLNGLTDQLSYEYCEDQNLNDEDQQSDEIDHHLRFLLEKLKIDISNNQDQIEVFSTPSTRSKLFDYEQRREFDVQKKVEEKKQEWDEKQELFAKQCEEQMKMIEKKFLLESMHQLKAYEKEYEQLENNFNKINFGKKNNLESQQNRGIKMKEIEEKQKLLIRQKELKKLQQMQYLQKFDSYRKEIDEIRRNYETYLKEKKVLISQDRIEHYRNLMIGFDQDIEVMLLSKKEFQTSDVEFCENKLQQCKNNFEEFVQQNEQIKTNESIKLESNKSVIENKIIDGQEKYAQTPSNHQTKSNTISKASKSSSMVFINMQTKLLKFEEFCQKFFDDQSKKQIRASIQIYIRSIINTICNISVEHLREKLLKLLNLYQRKQFEQNGQSISISEADFSYHFAINTAVKHFINVATKHRSISLKLAPVIIILWAFIPIFGDIFWAHLVVACPYVIPYFPDRNQFKNDAEFAVICGYQLNKKGQIESNESFHSRMFALIELYSAIIQCNMVENNHPRDLQYAWKWLATILNEEPKEALTALLLDAFISNSMHKLYAMYGRQFEKLINFIREIFIDKIQSITAAENRQSLMKLQSMLDDLEKKLARKNLPKKASIDSLRPSGLVPDQFFSKSFIFK
ncbi:hypothetical protein NH340_JMT00953 [Sarcoptes scabiei]|nr:hypothetical protein NH340_JMT00953 [Sarcoptes scabiei]